MTHMLKIYPGTDPEFHNEQIQSEESVGVKPRNLIVLTTHGLDGKSHQFQWRMTGVTNTRMRRRSFGEHEKQQQQQTNQVTYVLQ